MTDSGHLTSTEITELAAAFSHETKYEGEDPFAPINPLTYRRPDGDTCLHIAAFAGDVRSVVLLLKAGLDVNAVGDMECTPLHYAALKKRQEIIDILLAAGASRDIRNRFDKLPLEWLE
jgi:ankyrin repeat protein